MIGKYNNMKKLFIALLIIASAVGNVFSQSMTISGGNDNGLIICSQGYIYAWGKNMQSYGECLGVPSTDPNYNSNHMFLPGRVETNNLTFSQVTAGSGSFHYALSCHKLVYAWGDNTSFACGQGNLTTASSLSVPSPVLKGEVTKGYNEDGTPGGDYLGGVKWIAGSTSSGFAITEDNRCVMWGIPKWSGELPIGVTNENVLKEPIYIRDKNGDPIENVTHISGGDENVYMRTSDGELWALGPWNGNRNNKTINENYATKVQKDDGTPLTNIKMSAAGDQCGFAVTGDGFVWGWGAAWGGCSGQKGVSLKARKVNAGDYSKISGESFLTDVTQVIGGRGHGAAVTKEGYLLYWGVNDGTNGGVAPDPLAQSTTTEANPIFAFYCKPGTCDVRGDTVKDAVAISRGDNFDFMVNDKDEYFGWGINSDGQLGVGQGCDLYQCLTKIETIPCDIQDACPIVYMTDVKKCPGETITLNSGFTIPQNKEKSYYIEWYFNGNILNTSKIKKGASGNYIYDSSYLTDIYNNDEIEITEAGKYKVIAYYVGDNIPCDACAPDSIEITVTEMDMPIDTIINQVCTPADTPFNPTTEEMNFQATVNSFYNATDNVQFAVFATPDPTDKDTLTVTLDDGTTTKVYETTGNGGKISFTVTGSQINHDLGVGIEDNKDKPSKDTLYHVWIEDVTRLNTTLLPETLPTNTAAYTAQWDAGYGQLVNVKSNTEIISFSVFVTNTEKTAHEVEITPIIYKAGTEEYGNYIMGPLFQKGVKQTFPIAAGETKECIVKLNIVLPATAGRGAEYMISCEYKNDNCSLYLGDNGNPSLSDANNKTAYIKPVPDTEGFGISAIGNIVNKAAGSEMLLHNFAFGKMTDYDCGRIPLTLKRYCPPCNDPKKLEITASETIKDDVDAKYKKVVELCKESDVLVLDIEPLEGKNDPTAKFDIFWYDENPLGSPTAKAIKEDETGNATTLELKTDWATVAGAADIKKDVEKVYYIKVHDHEKPGCVHYDSIKVIAHPAPVDSLDWMEFCEGSLATEPTFEIADMTINWVDEPTNVVSLTGPATGTGTKEYTYKYKVVDNKTGCESVEHTLTISVNKTGKPDVKEQITLLKDPSVKYNLSAAENNVDTDCEIHWYESETATSEMTNKSIPLDNADTIIVWAEQYNTVTKCTSERVKVEIIINDAPVPEVTNESLCLDNEIPSLAEYVKAKEHHELKWYDDPAAAKGTGSETAPSFKATAAGTYKFYVSQKDSVTNAESEKATLTITVHEVATLDLSANKTEYCINETAEELTFKANSDGDFTTANWSKKSDMSDATATLTPKTDEKGDVTYYAQAEYTNKDAQKKYASTVCYGKIQDITITTNMTNAPLSNTNFTVQYLKAEGDKNKSYKPLLDQDNTAVITEAGHTLKWYDSNKNPLSAEPAPEYIDNETGERTVTYWVSQVNTSTGCESELIEVTAIISSFPAPEVKAITLCQESEKLKTSFPLTAKKSTKGGFSESDYELIWYKEDPKSNPSAEEFTTIDLHLEDLSYDATTVAEKDFKYWVVQRYLGQGGGQSPAAELQVTIYSKPVLKTKTPDPICLGGEVDLKDLYSISNRITNQQYELEYLSSNGTNPKGSIATVHGWYQSRAWFELSSGEICRSKFEDVFVTVNELEVAIKGDNTTCPGIGVELKAVLKTNNMDANDVPSYSWNVSPTGVTGQMETLNTSSEGLNKKGDKLTVDLEVSMGACKGKKPVNAHIVTVEDPGVEGTIKFDEQYNANSGKGTFTLSKDGTVVFDGCNSKVDVLFNVKQTEDKFTYENLETGEKKTGTFSNGEGKFDIKAGLYEVTYTNTCATSFKFDVKDKSLDITGIALNWSVCEGTPLTINIVNFKDRTPFAYDSKKEKIEWQKDGNPLPGYDTEVLYIPSTTPADNGVYSYTVTSSGCVYHEKIAMGGSFKSKPKVKINESLLAKDGIYEAVRTTAKEITIPIIQSVGIDMSKLKDKIVWRENGDTINKGEKLSLSSVDADHEYNIVIANGEKGYDPEFCGTSLDITLKVDALLSIEAILVDANGKQTKDMCLNEEGVGFKIDTTGTGTILHPDKFTFKIVETIDGVKKDIGLAKKDDYLFAEISPNKSAKYDIVYKYEVGNQDSSKVSEITVHPAYEVDWDRNVRLCEGETGFIQITKAEPASEIELKWESDECLINGSQNGANVKAVFSGSGLVEKKAMTLVASNGGICADKKFYPEFTIDKAIEGNIIAPEFVCEGHTTTLDASPFKATEYVWSSTDQLGEGVTLTGPSINVVSKPGYASYIVEMKRGACSQTADATIEVRYAPRFDRIDSLSFRSIEIVLQSNTGTAPFQYIVDDNYDDKIGEPIKDNLEYGNHNVKIIDAAGCLIDSSFVTHAPGLEFPIHISPNGDGINDAFSIPVLRDAYPDANIRIYDRWGKKLADYKAGNAEMDWDGTYNGVQMPSTDYWYEIEIKEIKKTYTGHFTLIRQ